MPNNKSSLGFRTAITVFASIFLGKNLSEGNGFFVSLFLFSMPLLYDYFRFNPIGKIRLLLKGVSISLLVIEVFVSALGMGTILNIKKVPEGFMVVIDSGFIVFAGHHFTVAWVWVLTVLTAGFSCIDWIVAKRKIEDQFALEN